MKTKMRIKMRTKMKQKQRVRKMKKNQKVWYYKLKHVIDYIRDASMAMIWILGTCLALDAIMVQFSRQSLETHCIKSQLERVTNCSPFVHHLAMS
eukprot:15357831-Ditylum_brightwellii.AAC.1